jgi:hypothetical protein
MRNRLALAGVLSLAIAALSVSAASARTAFSSYSFTATGVETGVPVDNVSPFSGAALGTGGVASWSASVPHQALNSCGVTQITTGGSFSLSGTSGVRLSGSFTGGTVTAPAGYCAAGQPCGNETFAIDGLLTINGTLTGEFKGSLNHFSTMILGNCVTYFATISGRLTAGPTP